MRKEEFFEILGEMDDKLVEEAEQSVREKEKRREENKRRKKGKKPVNWKTLSAMAACFMLVCIALGQIPFMNHQNESTADSPMADSSEEAPMEEAEAPAEEAVPGDIAPMIYVNNTLYITSPVQEGYTEWKEEFSYLGKIESEVSSDREPEENFQANDPLIGCEVYQYGEDIVVKINGKYWLYVEYGGEKR